LRLSFAAAWAHLQRMKRFPAFLAAALAACACASAAGASEVIATAGQGAGAPPAAAPSPLAPPPLPADENSPEAIGAWARGVMAGQPSREAVAGAPAPGGRCPAPPDSKPHGEVWAGIGTGGYREAGGVVTQPVGDCGEVTLGVSRTQGGWR
jgi:hypothetical protein